MNFVQAKVLVPSMFMAQEPHTPSRQERRKVRVESTSFLILISASRTIGPQSSTSIVIAVDARVLAAYPDPSDRS